MGRISTLFLATLAWTMTCATTVIADPGLVVAEPSYREVTLSGFTRARATLPLVAETTGRVLEVTSDIGDLVDPPGIFARLDPTFIRLDLEANRVQQEQLRSHIDYDARETKRYRALVSKGSASKSNLDELEQVLRDNRHRLDELKVQERILEERLVRTEIKAPVGWHVTRRGIEPGQRVNEGEVLGETADFSTLLVPFALSPGQFAALKAMDTAPTIRLPDRNLEVPARIFRSNPGFDPVTRKIAVDLALGRAIADQRGGLRVFLTLRLPERTGAVMLPASAVEQSYEEYWVTREDGRRLRVVKLGNHAGVEGNWLRVASPEINPGDRFRLTPPED